MAEFDEFKKGLESFLDSAGPESGVLAVCVALPPDGSPVAWAGAGSLRSPEEIFGALALAMKSMAAPFVRSDEDAAKLLESCLDWCRRTRDDDGKWLQQAGSWDEAQMPDPDGSVPVQ